MYADIFAILAPIAICTLIGYGWARSGVPYEGEFVTRLVMNIGAPCLVVGTLSKTSMPAQDLIEILGAAAMVLVTTGLIAVTVCKLARLPVTVYLAPLSFPNTVNMGLPVCFFAFGEEGLAVALGIYLVVSLTQFSFGVALVSGQNAWKNSLRSPIVYSGLFATGLVLTATRLPLWIENSLNLLGSLSIPIMLITLGVSLSQLRVKDLSLSGLLGVSRLLIGLAVGFFVAEVLALEGTIRGVVIIQSAMPAAVFNYLLAQRYNRSPEAVAGLVVMSTLFSFASLPLLLWLVL
ncbi:AEC family transporter [Oceanicoccus sagamiensis]|uniref:Transporter n=1 Tax=Oceanicoccus sagamiensis TaxID=716816 RepID=A0A1X9NAU3_9GAMM|nr:AEC family transporter [Oceanicoccus sagamiensis]ARN74736.1 hypothetical protein BST96_11760 [Oceanicoccus sagamiensis]